MKPLAVETIVTGHTATDTMAMAGSKRFLYTAASKDKEVLIWDKFSRALVGRIPRVERVAAVALHADRKHVFVAGRTPILRRYTLKGTEKGHVQLPSTMSGLHGDEEFLYSVTWDRMLNVVAKSELQIVARRPVGGFKGYGPAVGHDRDHVYVAAPLGEIHAYAKDGFALIAHAEKGAREARHMVVVDDRLYVACGDRCIRVFDRHTLKRIDLLRSWSTIRAMALDDRYIYIGGFDETLVVLAHGTGEQVCALERLPHVVNAIVADGREIYLGAGNCDIMIVPRSDIERARGETRATRREARRKKQTPAEERETFLADLAKFAAETGEPAPFVAGPSGPPDFQSLKPNQRRFYLHWRALVRGRDETTLRQYAQKGLLPYLGLFVREAIANVGADTPAQVARRLYFVLDYYIPQWESIDGCDCCFSRAWLFDVVLTYISIHGLRPRWLAKLLRTATGPGTMAGEYLRIIAQHGDWVPVEAIPACLFRGFAPLHSADQSGVDHVHGSVVSLDRHLRERRGVGLLGFLFHATDTRNTLKDARYRGYNVHYRRFLTENHCPWGVLWRPYVEAHVRHRQSVRRAAPEELHAML